MSFDAIYFGGIGTDLGRVKALRHSTFKELVERLLNIAVTLNVTRKEFHEMPKARRDKAKRAVYLVPACFTESESRRLTENATHCNLVFLDIDSAELAMPYFNAPETIAEQLMPFDFAVYTTASSTPEAPRLRIVVSAEEISLERYKHAVRKVARMIGLSEITPESLVPIQPMYLPTLFKDDSEDCHPLLIYSFTGRAMTMNDVSRDKDKDDPADKGKKSLNGKDYTSGDALDYLRPNVPEVTLAIAAEAMEHLDPDMSYAEWLEVASALRHQFYGSADAEAAYELFDKWSQKGVKYAGEKDTSAKWNSLRPHPVNRVPVTIRTLLLKATQAGWSNTSVKDRVFQGVVRWMVDPDRTASQLLSEGLGRILAAPLLSQAEEESLLHQIADQCRKRFGMKVGLSSLRKDMAELRLEMKENLAKKKTKTVPAWAKGLCYVGSVNKFYRQSTREQFEPSALNIYYSRKLLPTEQELKDMGAAANPVKPVIPPVEFLMNQVQIPTVYDYVYDPRFPNDTFLHADGKPFVNLYVANHPEPDRAQAAYAGKLFMTHLRHLIKEEEYRTTVMDFLAHIVQFPGKKIRWAMLIQGVEGCGKTFIAKAMDAVLGRGHVRNVDASALNSQWNEWAYGAQMVVLEEIRVVGHSRHDVMNVLKPLISNDYINVNQRHRDSRQTDNTVNYLLFTNHHDAIVVSNGDRRYFVVKSAMQTKEDVAKLPHDYFTDLFNMLGTHAAGLRSFLEGWNISDTFQPSGHAPRTKYLYELLHDTANENTQAVREAINDNPSALVSRDLVGTSAMLAYLEASPHVNTRGMSGAQLASILRDEGFRRFGRFALNGEREHLWVRLGTPLAASQNLVAEVTRRIEQRAAIEPEEWSLLD
jgi:hypothetical protein